MTDYDARTLTTYADLYKFTDLFAAPDGLRFLIILGNPGIGKTRTIKARLSSSDCGWMTGALSAFYFYKQLYVNLDRPIVIDDVDALFKDKAACNLLKCLCQTEHRKAVQWGKATKQLDAEGIPRSFNTQSRVCILGNKMPRVDADLEAVLSRATVINFYPSVGEVHKQAKSFVKDKEVYDFFGQHLKLITRPALRTYSHAIEDKRLGIDWKTNLLERWKDVDKLTLVAAIMEDASLTDTASRAARFQDLGGGSRATWFRFLNQWKTSQGVVSKLKPQGVIPKIKPSEPVPVNTRAATGRPNKAKHACVDMFDT
jgi:hypothetical protein